MTPEEFTEITEPFRYELLGQTLDDAAGAFLVRPVRDEQRGWRWVADPL